MKQPRTLKIVRLITEVVSSILKNDKLILNQTSEGLERLGGIYIKFLQLVVLHVDPHDQSGYRKLLEVYEGSTPDQIDIRRYLAHELGPDKLAMIKSIEPQPFATGSFGQVYRGELLDGQKVIIKVLRPSVTRYLRYDLRLIGILCWVYGMIDRQKLVSFKNIFHDFKNVSLQETDYIREAAVAQNYYESYQDHSNLVIPKTHISLCSKHVLVQEKIVGVSVTQLLELQISGNDAREYAYQYLQSDLFYLLKVVGVELLDRVLAGQIMHADPHPGNLIVLPNNKIALIDFGMTAGAIDNRQSFYEVMVQYDNYYSGNLAIDEFTIASLKFFAPELYEAIARSDEVLGANGESFSLMAKLRESIEQYYNDKDNQVFINQLMSRRQLTKVLFFAVNKDNRFGFSFEVSALALIKAIQSYLVLCGKFDETGQLIVRPVFTETVARGSSLRIDSILNSPSVNLSPGEALEVLSCWFDKIGRNDPWLMNRLAGGIIE